MRRSTGRAHRLDEQVSVLGGRRSGEMGARRLRLHSRRQPRRRPLAGRDRYLVAARGAGSAHAASSGPACSPGRTARSASTAFPITRENQWQTSALQPKHLAAICTWEGAADFYRDMAHHGGIFCRGFVQDWSKAQVYSVQNGRGTRGFKSRMNGDWVSGPETLSEEQLGRNRRDFYEDCISRKLDTDRLLAVAHAGLDQGEDAAALLGELGRTGPASARQFRGFRALGVRTEMARSARHRALDAFLHELRRRPAEEVLRPFPQGRGHRLGASSRRCCCRFVTPARNSSSGTRTNGRSRARSGPNSTSSGGHDAVDGAAADEAGA